MARAAFLSLNMATKLISDYGSSEDSETSEDEKVLVSPLNTIAVSEKLSLAVVAAPDVLPNVSQFELRGNLLVILNDLYFFQANLDPLRHIDPTSKEIMYNPKAEELFAPTLGPDCPFKSEQMKAHRNTLAGFVEPAHLSEFQFEAQRKTFTSFGTHIHIFFFLSHWMYS